MEGHGHYAYAGYPLLPPSRLTGTPPDCSCAQETIPTGTIPITEAPKARLGEVPPGSSPIFICTLHPLGVGSCFGDFQPSGPLTSFLEWTGVSPCLQGASLCLPEAVRQQGCAILSSSRGSCVGGVTREEKAWPQGTGSLSLCILAGEASSSLSGMTEYGGWWRRWWRMEQGGMG